MLRKELWARWGLLAAGCWIGLLPVACTAEAEDAVEGMDAEVTSPDGAASSDDVGGAAPLSPDDFAARGMRYCEIVLGYLGDDGFSAEVWGTQGLNMCPAALWDALDPAEIQATYEALLVKMNGPRYFLMNGFEGTPLIEPIRRTYGDLEMHRLATVVFDAPPGAGSPFTPVTVLRDNTWIFNAGEEVYELIDPEGTPYVMQAYAQIVDPTLTEADLPELGSRIALPEGWVYRARTLIDELRVVATGEATVVQDDLENTYQRY